MLETLAAGQLLFAALALGALYALVALGLNLVYGTMRLLNVAHGDLVMLGGYATYWAFAAAGIPPLAAVLLTASGGAALGAGAYRGLFRRLLAAPRATARIEANSLLAFFGLSVIVQNLAALAFTATPRGYEYLSGVVRIGEVAVTGGRLAAVALALALCAAVLAFLRRHVLGLAMRALVEQREAAAVVGVDIDRAQRASFVLGFGTAAVAGTLLSMTEQVSPFMGFPITIAAFVVVIMGGLGRIEGTLAAAFLLGAIETYGVALTSPTYRSILVYGLFVTVLLVRPQGLLGRRAIVR
ncbi:MAG: branched-chain amino acid ABC transporter permease [Burkholderiales bacterium]|nr:branched-chain amino acid ABC transporter permease [Burkholderiales bacterium]